MTAEHRIANVRQPVAAARRAFEFRPPRFDKILTMPLAAARRNRATCCKLSGRTAKPAGDAHPPVGVARAGTTTTTIQVSVNASGRRIALTSEITRGRRCGPWTASFGSEQLPGARWALRRSIGVRGDSIRIWGGRLSQERVSTRAIRSSMLAIGVAKPSTRLPFARVSPESSSPGTRMEGSVPRGAPPWRSNFPRGSPGFRGTGLRQQHRCRSPTSPLPR